MSETITISPPPEHRFITPEREVDNPSGRLAEASAMIQLTQAGIALEASNPAGQGLETNSPQDLIHCMRQIGEWVPHKNKDGASSHFLSLDGLDIKDDK